MKVDDLSVGAHPLCPECFGQILSTDPDPAQSISHIRIPSDNNNRAVERFGSELAPYACTETHELEVHTEEHGEVLSAARQFQG